LFNLDLIILKHTGPARSRRARLNRKLGLRMFHILLPEDAAKTALIAAGYLSVRGDLNAEAVQSALQRQVEQFIFDTRAANASNEERLRAIMTQI
jgi:hypothetical protein